MLEKLNETVPKLDEYDSNKMYNNISNKMNKKIKKPLNIGFILSFATAVLLIAILIPLGISMATNNSRNTNTPNTNNNNNNNQNFENVNESGYLTSENMLGVAAFKVFEKNNNSNVKTNKRFKPISTNMPAKVSFDNSENLSDDNPDKFSYEFDYVKILSAKKFSITIDDLSHDETTKEIIESNCGLGELDVVIAKFETYIVKDGSLCSAISDELISIRGYNGYYTILLNSYLNWKGIEVYAYSSHKTITESAVEKDFTGTITTIFVRKENDRFYVSFRSEDNISSVYNYDLEHEYVSSDIELANGSEVYSVLNLNTFTTTTIEGVIKNISIDTKILSLEVSGGYRIVLLSSNKINILNFNIGDEIIVEYAKLYDEYTPHYINAISIIKK